MKLEKHTHTVSAAALKADCLSFNIISFIILLHQYESSSLRLELTDVIIVLIDFLHCFFFSFLIDTAIGIKCHANKAHCIEKLEREREGGVGGGWVGVQNVVPITHKDAFVLELGLSLSLPHMEFCSFVHFLISLMSNILRIKR